MEDENKPTPALEGEIVNQLPPVSLTKHPEEIVGMLESGFKCMFNITEACQYAGISRETYYTWLGDDDVFSYRMSVAQQSPNMTAKQNIITALNAGDTNISKWYLERRDPDFKTKGQLDIIPPGEQRAEDKLREFMNDTDDGAYEDTAGTDAGRTEPPAADISAGGDEVAPSPTDIS